MICSNGHQNAEGVRFCGTCGANMGGAAQFPAPPSGVTVTGGGVNFQSLKGGLLQDLERHRHSGHPTTLQSAMTMVSGALFAFAVLVIALNSVGSGDSNSPYSVGVLWSILGCIAAYVVVKFVSADLAAAATTAFVPLSAVAVLLLFGSQLKQGKTGIAFVIAGLVSLVAWFLPILRGRPALLASALLMTSLGLVVLMVQSSIADSANCSYYNECVNDPSSILSSTSQNAATLLLIMGIVLLAVASVLDRRDWPQLGRVFIGVGIVFEVSGAVGIFDSTSDKTAGSILLLIAGALLVAVAVRQSRKASMLIGGVGAAIGITAFGVAITESNDSPTVFAILMIASAVGIGYLALKKSQAMTASLQQRP